MGRRKGAGLPALQMGGGETGVVNPAAQKAHRRFQLFGNDSVSGSNGTHKDGRIEESRIGPVRGVCCN